MRTTFQAPITAFSTQNRMNTLPAGQPKATTPSTVIAFRLTASATGSTQVRVARSVPSLRVRPSLRGSLGGG